MQHSLCHTSLSYLSAFLVIIYSDYISISASFSSSQYYDVTATAGTGKSKLMHSIATALARNNGVKVLEISHDILLARYMGEGEKKLRQIFRTAHRCAPPLN